MRKFIGFFVGGISDKGTFIFPLMSLRTDWNEYVELSVATNLGQCRKIWLPINYMLYLSCLLLLHNTYYRINSMYLDTLTPNQNCLTYLNK